MTHIMWNHRALRKELGLASLTNSNNWTYIGMDLGVHEIGYGHRHSLLMNKFILPQMAKNIEPPWNIFVASKL